MFKSIFRGFCPLLLLLTYAVSPGLQGRAASSPSDSTSTRNVVETDTISSPSVPKRPPIGAPKSIPSKARTDSVESQPLVPTKAAPKYTTQNVSTAKPAPVPDFTLTKSTAGSNVPDFDLPISDEALTESLNKLSSDSEEKKKSPSTITNVLPTFENAQPFPGKLPEAPRVGSSQPQGVPQQVEAILAEGTALEEKKQWADAMVVYEKAMKNYADQPQILQRYRTCRYHYEIGRRYRDTSFEQFVFETPLSEVLKLYTDVFTRIEGNHVDSPDWKTLFGYGMDDLEIALNDPEFLKRNKIQASPEKLETLQRKIRETAQPWSFRHIQDMKNGVLCVAELAQNEIGLRPSAVLMEFVCGAAFGLDPHTSYLTLRQLNDFYSMIEGSFVGIGVELDSSDPDADMLTILKVHPNSPAMSAGLRDGDCILAVNGTPTAGLGLDRAADLLQGEFGSTVVLQTRTPAGKQREVRIVRREVEVASVEDVHIIEGSIGYVRINCFQAGTTRELVSAMDTLQRQGMKSLIIDLRRNPGGLLPVAVEIANMFLDKGIIVRTQDRNSQTETVWRAETPGTSTIPLYVLIDEESASASEIFAGAIRDHKRGLLIGHQSYGKGTVQIIYRLSGKESNAPIAGLKLTVERFYSPDGLPFCNVGVQPDIVPEIGETVLLSKPDVAAGTIAQAAPKRKQNITSSPNDPCIAEVIAASKRITHSRP